MGAEFQFASAQVVVETARALAAEALLTPLFGAVVVAPPTGTAATDDANIATAIAAAGSGGSVIFQNGTYVADNLVPATGQTWIGTRTTLKRPNSSALSVITATGLSDFRLIGVIGEGNRGSASATSNSWIRLTNATRPRILDCTFQNMPTNNAAVELHGSTDGLVSRNSFTTVGYAILGGLLTGESYAFMNNVISENVIDGTDKDAVFLTENLGTNLTSTTIASGSNGQTLPQAMISVASTTGLPTAGQLRINGLYGDVVTYTGVSGGNTLTGCSGGTGTLATGQTVKIYVAGLIKGTVFTGNTVSNYGDCGIESGIGTVGTSITGNTFIGNGSTSNQGILFRDALNCVGDGNTCQGATKVGGIGINVWFGNYVSLGVTLAGNDCSGNGAQGILATSAVDLGIYGGSISGNGTAGVRLTGGTEGYTIDGVAVVGNGQQGIFVGQTGSTGCSNGVISNNRVKNNSTSAAGSFDGIVLGGSSTGLLVTGNRCHDTQAVKTQRNGIRVFDSTVQAVIEGNDVTGNSSTGLNNAGASVLCQIGRNQGFNPVGLVAVSVPLTTVAIAAASYDRWFYVTAGASTCACAVTNTGGTNQTVATIPSGGFGAVFVPAAAVMIPTYSAAPTWTVQGA